MTGPFLPRMSVFGRAFVSAMISDHSLSVLSVLSVCNVGILWPNGWMDEDEAWYAGRPRPWPHSVRWGHPPNGQSPQFSAHVCCGQMAGRIKMPLGRKVGLDPSDTVLDGDPARPSPKKDTEPPDFRLMYIVATRQYGSKGHFVWR